MNMANTVPYSDGSSWNFGALISPAQFWRPIVAAGLNNAVAPLRSFGSPLPRSPGNSYRRPAHHGFRLAGLLVVLIAAATTATPCSAQTLDGTPQQAKDAISTMVYEGFTEPHHDIMVAAAEIGRLDAVHVEVGDHVEAGQVIGQLEDALQGASVKIAKMQAGMTGEWEASKAEWVLNETRAINLRKLAGEGMARPDELRRAEADVQISFARRMAAEEQLQLRALELERYQLQLDRRKIRSPMSGVISQIFHKPGEYITPGDPAVVRLLVMDKLFAVFNVPVEDIPRLRIGAPARIYLRSSSATLDATITSVAPDIDGESGTVKIRVELDNSAGQLLAGDRCTLRLLPDRRPTQAERPRAALLPPLTKGAQRR